MTISDDRQAANFCMRLSMGLTFFMWHESEDKTLAIQGVEQGRKPLFSLSSHAHAKLNYKRN